MCKLHPNLDLGWYYGTKDESYCDYIVDIINNFALQNNYNNIVFFASSSGGFAALYCACKIKKSTAIVINPQIRLKLYIGAKKFQTITGLDLTIRDKFERNHLPELIRDAKDTKFIIIENSASDVDAVQINDLCEVLNTNYHYGLNLLTPNILSWVYGGDTDQPHNAQEYYPMIYSITFLEKHFDTATKYSDIFLVLSELWNDHYNLLNELQKATRKVNRRVDCIAALPTGVNMAVRFKKVIENFNIEIPANDNPYNFHCVYNKLEPNSLYKFAIGNVKVTSGNTVKYSIIVKDNLTYTVDFMKNFDLTNSNIYTGQDTEKKELRIYSGEAGKTNNIALKIGFYELTKIELESKVE